MRFRYKFFWIIFITIFLLMIRIQLRINLEKSKENMAKKSCKFSIEVSGNLRKNISREMSSPILIYNRIPKTGSTSFANILYESCKRNKLHVVHVNITNFLTTLSLQDQHNFVQNITDWYRPAVYHGHFAYIDFKKFGVETVPLYINIIRDPLERLVSHYYFLRFGDDYRVGLKRSKQGDKTTFDECVQKKGKDCDPKKLWLQIPYFCGQNFYCLKPGNKWALEEAKRNLVHNYMLVGTTEKIGEFINALEIILPTTFRGISEMFFQGLISHLRNTLHKDPISDQTMGIFQNSEIWKMEMEFYLFAKEHFELIQKSLKR